MKTNKSLELSTLKNFGIIASVDLKKSVNTNVKSIIDASTASKDRQAIVKNATAKQKSLSEVLRYLLEECETEIGKKALNSNLLTIDFFTTKNVQKCLSYYLNENNEKVFCIVVKKNDKNTFVKFNIIQYENSIIEGETEKINTNLLYKFSKIDDGFLTKIDKKLNLIILDKNGIEYTFQPIINFSFSFVVNRLAKFKKVLLTAKIQAIKAANMEKAEKEILAAKVEKAEKAKAEKAKEKAEAEAKAEAEKAESEKEIQRLKNIEQQFLEMQKKLSKKEKLEKAA